MFIMEENVETKAFGNAKSTTIVMVRNVLQKLPLKEIEFLLGGENITMMLLNHRIKHNHQTYIGLVNRPILYRILL